MKAVEVTRGHPLGGRVAASDVGARRPIGVGFDCNGRAIASGSKPHKSTLWMRTALSDMCNGGGEIDQHHWEPWAFDGARYVQVTGGVYFVHERGEDPDVWLEGSKADLERWLAERGYLNPLDLAKAPKVHKVTTPPDSPVESRSDGLVASVARHPSGGISAELARAELQRRKDKRAAIRGGMSKADAAKAFPPIDQTVFGMRADELKEVAA